LDEAKSSLGFQQLHTSSWGGDEKNVCKEASSNVIRPWEDSIIGVKQGATKGMKTPEQREGEGESGSYWLKRNQKTHNLNNQTTSAAKGNYQKTSCANTNGSKDKTLCGRGAVKGPVNNNV